MTMVANESELFFDFLGNGSTEIRALRPAGPPSIEVASDSDDFVDRVTSKNGEFSGVYCTLNRINPDALHRMDGHSVGDDDIERLTTLFFDIDPVRSKGAAATDAQHELALKKAEQLEAFLKAQQWFGVKIDSGNGAYLLYKIDLDPADAYLVEGVLRTMDELLSTEEVKIDTCVYNPSRICRVPGTMNRKAEPHRPCQLLTEDILVPRVSREQLEKIICHDLVQVPAAIKPKIDTTERISPEELSAREQDLADYMQRHGFGCTKKTKTRDGGRVLLHFDKCAAHGEAHSDGQNGKLILHGNGRVSFKCHHEKHHGVTWQEVQERLGETFHGDLLRHYNDPERLAEVYRKRTRQDGIDTVFTDGKSVYRYLEQRWLDCTDRSNQCLLRPTIVDEFAKFAASKRRTPAHVSNGLVSNTYAAVLAGVHRIIPPGQFAPYWLVDHPWDAMDVLPVANGIINLREYCTGGEYFLPLTPQLFTDSVSEVEYDAEATCPHFHKFLESLEREPEWYELLQQLFGYTLWLGYDLQKFVVMVGPGGSGKGVLITVLRALVAQSFASINLSNLSDNDNHGLQECPGKRLITIPEARMPARDAAQIVDQFKAITGGDPVRVNPKNKAPFTCPIDGTVWVAANRLNIMPDASNAINRRMIPLPFTKSFSGLNGNPSPDLSLPQKLAGEYAGILNWALEGVRKLHQNGGEFTLPESSRDMLQEAIHQSSPLQEFLAEKCEIDPRHCVRTVSAYKLYREWAGQSHLSESDFVSELITASGHRVEKHRMGSATSTSVKDRPIQRTQYDTPGRAHVFLNLRFVA